MYKKFRKVQIISLCFVMLCVGFLSYIPKVSAQEPLHTQNGIVSVGSGTAKILLKGNPGQSLIGKKFGLYQLFTAENSTNGESIAYHVNDQYKIPLQKAVAPIVEKTYQEVTEKDILTVFQSYHSTTKNPELNTNPVESNESLFRYFMEDVQKYLDQEQSPSIDFIVNDCIPSTENIEIQGLDFGYYAIHEVSDNTNKHAATSLCMVTTANPNSEVQIKSDVPTIVKKIYDEYVEWNDIGDYEIGEKILYKHTVKIPNMNGYKKYELSIHDQMDEALTIHKDSFKITLRLEDGTSYPLVKDTDYAIAFASDSTITDGCSFEIVVQDLKAVYQKYVTKDSKDLAYQGELVVEYDAHLNELAANNAGRPGFENNVKLEYSNNPNTGHEEEKGETDWDSVVCFTFDINGTKMNDKGVVLKGAKFKLYRDEKCTDEVKLTQGSNGYIVQNQQHGSTDGIVEFIESDEEGKFVIHGLNDESYFLKEVEAPAGYQKLDKVISVIFFPTYQTDRNNYVKGTGAGQDVLKKFKAITYMKDLPVTFDMLGGTELQSDADKGAAYITVINKVGTKLPITGSNATLVLLAAGCTCSLIGIYRTKKRKQQELG